MGSTVHRLTAILILALLLSTSPTTAATPDRRLVTAVTEQDTQTARALLAEGVDVNAPAVDGSTALHWAVHRGAHELVDLLIDAGADVTVANRYGVRPLSLASVNGNADVIEALLEAGANPNTSLPGGETALMTAARTGVAAAIRILVAHGADVNARDEVHGQTAMMWAAARGNAEAIHVLAEVGGDVHARTEREGRGRRYNGHRPGTKSPDPTGFTPVMFAARAGHVDAVRVLLEAGANVNDTLSDGQSVLVVATANANWELADYLLDKGADPNRASAGWNALHQTVRTRRMNLKSALPGPIPSGTVDSIDMIKKMLAKGVDVNARMTRNGMKDGQRSRFNRLGATAFLLAAKGTDIEAMQVLVEAGADPNIKNAENTTPLMVAAGVDIWNPGEDGGSLPGQEDEVLEAVTICVVLGSDVNAVNDLGVTALHGAAYRGVNIVAEYLVEQGAKLDARDMNGWIPWAIADGFSYSNFYKAQKHTAALLASYMAARGMSIDGEAIPGSVCLDCYTSAGYVQSELERDTRMEAEYAVTHGGPK